MRTQLSFPFILIVCISLLTNCNDAEVIPKEYPFIVMDHIDVREDGVVFFAKVENLEDQEVNSYGFLWNINDVESEEWSRIQVTEPIPGEVFMNTVNSDLLEGRNYFVRPFIKINGYSVVGPSLQFTSKGSKPPEIFDYSPKQVMEGDVVKLTGRYFSYRSDGAFVYVQGRRAPIIWSSSDSLVFTIPQINLGAKIDLRIRVAQKYTRLEDAFSIIE